MPILKIHEIYAMRGRVYINRQSRLDDTLKEIAYSNDAGRSATFGLIYEGTAHVIARSPTLAAERRQLVQALADKHNIAINRWKDHHCLERMYQHFAFTPDTGQIAPESVQDPP